MGILLNIHLILSDVLIPCFKSVQRQMEGHNLHCLVWHTNLLPHALTFWISVWLHSSYLKCLSFPSWDSTHVIYLFWPLLTSPSPCSNLGAVSNLALGPCLAMPFLSMFKKQTKKSFISWSMGCESILKKLSSIKPVWREQTPGIAHHLHILWRINCC